MCWGASVQSEQMCVFNSLRKLSLLTLGSRLIIIIIIQHLYSAIMSYADTEALVITHSIVRVCCKDDCESLWKSLKFDPSPRKYGLTDHPPNLHRLLRPGYLPKCKILCRSDQSFDLPIWVKYNS